jgi:hypothetical protein
LSNLTRIGNAQQWHAERSLSKTRNPNIEIRNKLKKENPKFEVRNPEQTGDANKHQIYEIPKH